MQPTYFVLVLLLIVPHVMRCQDAGLSEAARKLLRKPRLGDAMLTLKNGHTVEGQVAQVTRQSAVVSLGVGPCETVALSEVASIRWIGSESLWTPGVVFGGPILLVLGGIAEIGHEIELPFKRLHPPVKPLEGSWEVRENSLRATLVFNRKSVFYNTRRWGRWSAADGLLHLEFDGAEESPTPFHFECGALVLEKQPLVLERADRLSPPDLPLSGEWADRLVTLVLKPDGSAFEERKAVRVGTFENDVGSVTIRWSDRTVWKGKIRGHLVLIQGDRGLNAYHYQPPPLDFFDL